MRGMVGPRITQMTTKRVAERRSKSMFGTMGISKFHLGAILTIQSARMER